MDPRGVIDLSGHDYAAESRQMYERGKMEGASDKAAGREPNHYLYYGASTTYSQARGYREGYGGHKKMRLMEDIAALTP